MLRRILHAAIFAVAFSIFIGGLGVGLALSLTFGSILVAAGNVFWIVRRSREAADSPME